MIRGIATLGLVFIALGNLSAQSKCACDIINLKKSDSLASLNDSSVFKDYLQELEKSENIICKVFEKELRINFKISKRDKEFIDLVKEQEVLINSSHCKDSLQSLIYRNYAVYFKGKEDFENLSKYAFKHLDFAEKTKSKKDEIAAIRNISYVFGRQNEDTKLYAYLARARRVIYSMPPSEAQAERLIWLALNYETFYTISEDKAYLDTSYTDANQAMRMARQYNDYLNMGQVHRILDAINYHKGDLTKATFHIDSSIYYLKKVKIPLNLSSLFLSKAMNYADQGKRKQALSSLDSSLAYCQRMDANTIAHSNMYFAASQVYEELGEVNRAFEAFKKYEYLKDSLFNEQRSATINELEQKYFKAKNEQTIRELSQQQKIFWLLLAVAMLALASLAFFIREQSLKNKQKILETEQRLNRARINPHFFFNALGSIQSYALQGHDNLEIASSISKFSHIMRETLESTYKEYITIEEEIEFLEEYLELQKMRFPEKYVYEIYCDDDLDTSELVIPAMILQPFVENSIEHGFENMKKVGHLVIRFSRKDNVLYISITDNGKGLQDARTSKDEHISRAGQIIKDRIYLLNMKLKTEASFSIRNNSKSEGVTVCVELPLLKKSPLQGS